MDRKADYAAKLRDPRWQKKRLEVLERDQWTCQCCNASDKTLHVHHIQYSLGDPWDTPASLLVTACWECHEAEHENHKMALHNFLMTLGEVGIRTSLDLTWLDDSYGQYLHTNSDGKHFDLITVDEKTKSLGEAINRFAQHKKSAIDDGMWFV